MEKLISSDLFTIVNLIIFLASVSGMSPQRGGMSTWTFDLKSINTKTSDPEKLKLDLEIKRVSRGVFAISGEFIINFDIVEGDSNYMSAKCYRTPQSENDYKLLPYQMPSTHFHKVLDTYYKNILMDSIRNCSDLPVFEGKFVPPVEKRVYKIDGCQISQDGLPNHMQEGIYKTIIAGTGDVDYEIELITEAVSVL